MFFVQTYLSSKRLVKLNNLLYVNDERGSRFEPRAAGGDKGLGALPQPFYKFL